MPVLVENDAQRAQRLVATLPVGTQVQTSLSAVDEWVQTHPDEYAVVLGPNVSLGEATHVADRLRRTHPAVGVVLLRHQPGPEVYAEAMRAGIRGVVLDDDPAGLTDTVSRLRESFEAVHGPSASEHDGKVITVFSPKGGVGKTTVAVNLAFALADKGRARVCLVDLDLAFGDVAITLQLIPTHTVAEAIGYDESLDFNLLEQLLTRHEDGLAVLAAPTSPEGKERIAPAVIRSVLRTLRQHFDYVVVDTAPGFDDHVLQAFDETDECVLVATLDVPTIKNTKVAIETLDLLNLVPHNRHLVLNRADEEVGLNQGNVEDILGMKVSVALPSSSAVASATNHGQPIVLSKPDHPVSKAIIGLAQRIAGEALTAGKPEPARRGLFGRKK